MRRSVRRPLDPSRWPAVAAFFRGYLHQDAASEHAGVEQAFDAFWTDASDDERRAFAGEWTVLAGLVAGRAWGRVEPRLAGLGLAWMPERGSGFARLRRHVARAIGR